MQWSMPQGSQNHFGVPTITSRLATAVNITSLRPHSWTCSLSQEAQPRQLCNETSEADMNTATQNPTPQCPHQEIMERHTMFMRESQGVPSLTHHLQRVREHLGHWQVRDVALDDEVLHAYRGWVLTATH
ncbi:hypothetical protein GWK47_048489 [Chionoecetes opilio]|uniref:Uncharacterized protein n=1 Tax=Chionoecetes opilio TaxID=41210 RepID=A0A8J5CS91_CHIOP|nr:hypothetical protein GWK47_048489 [Chionoecetes opilio]